VGIAYQRGMVLYDQKRYAMAADEFRKELAQAPSSALAMAMLALSLNYDYKPKEALAHARAAVGADPERGFVHWHWCCSGPIPSGRKPGRFAWQIQTSAGN
jgi:Tfp pilus assembly protein PilF